MERQHGCPPVRQPAERLEEAYPARGASAAHMRRALRAYLARQAVDEETANAVVLAADEAFINAVDHSGAGGPVRVTACVAGGEATVEVQDGGEGFAYRGSRMRPQPDALLASGRGLYLIEHVMDDVSVASGRHGTTVRMVRRLAPSPSG
jgi:anti-sigma regulatory factor (Ser/Thr protein kinase)